MLSMRRLKPGGQRGQGQVRGRPPNKGVKMEYEVGVTIYGYIVVEAPSRNDAVEMFAAMAFDKILQDMKVNSIDGEHISKIKMRGGASWSNHKAGFTVR